MVFEQINSEMVYAGNQWQEGVFPRNISSASRHTVTQYVKEELYIIRFSVTQSLVFRYIMHNLIST